MDLMQREGKYPLPQQASKTVMGVEFAGVVTKLGEGATLKEGDEVFGLAFGVSHHWKAKLMTGRVCRIYRFA